MRQFILFLCVFFAGCSFSATREHSQTVADTSTPSDPSSAPVSEYVGHTSRYTVYDEPPVALKVINPKYPASMRSLGIEGDVVLTVEIFASGKVGEVEVFASLVPGPDGLDEAAVTAVRQWEFRPAKHNGEAVDCCLTLPVTFTLY